MGSDIFEDTPENVPKTPYPTPATVNTTQKNNSMLYKNLLNRCILKDLGYNQVIISLFR